MSGSPWAGFVPPPLFSFFLSRPSWLPGGGVCGSGSRPCRAVALWWLPSPVPVLAPFVPAPPAPFLWVSFSFFLLCPCQCGRWPATSREGRAPACPGCLSANRAAAVRSWYAWRNVFGLGGVVSRCPISGSCGCCLWCCLAGGPDCPPRFPSFPLAGGCALVERWGFPPSVLYFGAGNFASSYLRPPWARERTGRQTVWPTGLLLALGVAAGRAPAPCVV